MSGTRDRESSGRWGVVRGYGEDGQGRGARCTHPRHAGDRRDLQEGLVGVKLQLANLLADSRSHSCRLLKIPWKIGRSGCVVRWSLRLAGLFSFAYGAW